MLERTFAALRDECARFGQTERFEVLKNFLATDADKGDYERCAAVLCLTPSAVAVAIHRLRKRYRLLIRQEVARTVSDPADLEAELRHLFGSS